MPYLGSGSSMVWPPIIATPASLALSAPPHPHGEVALRKAPQVQRNEGRPPHRVHVAQRVRGGDATKVVGIVHDRSEEIGREDERAILGDPVNAGVISRGGADYDVRVLQGWKGAQDLRELAPAELAPSPRAVGILRQPWRSIRCRHRASARLVTSIHPRIGRTRRAPRRKCAAPPGVIRRLPPAPARQGPPRSGGPPGRGPRPPGSR